MSKFPHPRASVLAVHLALLTLASAAHGADATVADLTQPTNTISLGVVGANKNVARAQEYSGITSKSGQGTVDIDLSGGGAYDSSSAARWSLIGSDLGLGSPSLALDAGYQGNFRLRASYDELLRRKDDSFQTPYLGAGTNAFTLPSTWLVPLVPALSATTANARGLSPAVTNSQVLVTSGSGATLNVVPTSPTAAQIATATAIQAADLPLFHNVEIRTKRQNNSLGMDVQLGRNWTVAVRMAQEHRSGLRTQSTFSGFGGDNMAVLPTLVNDDTETAHVGVTYAGNGLVVDIGYDGSAYTNNAPSVTWKQFNIASATAPSLNMSTAPSNDAHKVYASVGYTISPMFKLVGHAAYGRGTQNETLLADISNSVMYLSRATANASVVTQQAGIKLIAKPIKDLSVIAAYKHDLRENHTPIFTSVFYDNAEAPATAVPAASQSPFASLFPSVTGGFSTSANMFSTRPYSKKVDGGTIEGDYQLNPNNRFSLGAGQSTTDRYCIGTWIDCSPAPRSTETTAHLSWQGQPTESLTARLGLSTSQRDVKHYNADAFLSEVTMANQVPATAAAAGVSVSAYAAMLALNLGAYGKASGAESVPTASLTALDKIRAFYYGSTVIGANTFLLNNPVLGSLMGSRNARISELPGLQSYSLTNKDSNKANASLGWQATETISLTTDLGYAQDKYKTAVYGLQSSTTTNLNLDGNWTPTDDTGISVYYSFEDQKQHFTGMTYNNNSVAAAANAVQGQTTISSTCSTTYANLAARNAAYKLDPCSNWSADNRDRTNTLGASLTKNKLLGGKLDVRAGLSFSQGRTNINFGSGGNYVNNPYAGVASAANGTIAAYYVPAVSLPTITVKSVDFLLAGTYRFSKDSAVRATFGYKRLSVTDWLYDTLAAGNLTTMLQTNEKGAHFGVSTFGLAVSTSFR